MAIKRSESGWLVDIQPAGRGGKRFRKTFATIAEAKAYEAWLKTQINKNSDWLPEKKDIRKLSELVSIWFDHHGRGLESGEDTFKRLMAFAKAVGDPTADTFSVNAFTTYRTKRLSEGLSANTLNREHAYIRSMFNELERLGYWSKENPLAKLRQFKIQEKELSYLDFEQIDRLFESLEKSKNPHVTLITKVCLSTGARWSEAEELRKAQIKNGLIQYSNTKSKKLRNVPISEELQQALHEHHTKHGLGAALFGPAFYAFREAIDRAEIILPRGQLTHALRHTFASHFVMNGGNILVLQKILGHQSLTMTMRYSHLAPDHLQEAKILNPLNRSSR